MRVGRFVTSVLTLLSLALLAGVVVLWVRSVQTSDALSYRRTDDAVLSLTTAPHALSFVRRPPPTSALERMITLPARGFAFQTLPWGRQTVTAGGVGVSIHITSFNTWRPPVNSALGFGWETDRAGVSRVVAPFWFLTILFSIGPVVWIRRTIRNRRRRDNGLCPHCGYDLRATPGRCPECGRDVPADFHPAAQRVESGHQ